LQTTSPRGSITTLIVLNGMEQARSGLAWAGSGELYAFERGVGHQRTAVPGIETSLKRNSRRNDLDLGARDRLSRGPVVRQSECRR